MLHFFTVNSFFIFYFLFVLSIGNKVTKQHEISRKFVHIWLCAWYFLCINLCQNVFEAIFTPFIFIIIACLVISGNIHLNSILNLIRKGEVPIGIVTFPFSLFIMVILNYYFFNDWRVGCVGIIALALGDSFAAIIGISYPVYRYKIFSSEKTLSGNLAMFLSSFLSIFIFLFLYEHFPISYMLFISFSLAVLACVVEAITPFGLDNLTIPLIISSFYNFVGRIL